jgi:formylglycine-generating enzyme required for sulfatase activity
MKYLNNDDDLILPPPEKSLPQRHAGRVGLGVGVATIVGVITFGTMVDLRADLEKTQSEIMRLKDALALETELLNRKLNKVQRVQEKTLQVEARLIQVGKTGHEACVEAGFTCGFVLSTSVVDSKTVDFAGWHVSTCDSKAYKSRGKHLLTGDYIRGPGVKGAYSDDLLLLEGEDSYTAYCITNPSRGSEIPFSPITGGSVDYPMVQVPAGTFVMGSPGDEAGRYIDEVQHWVTLSRGIWMGTTEVTQGLWRAVMGSNPSTAEYEGVSLVGATLPAQTVSWCEAVAFANRLSAREGLPAAYRGVDQCEASEGTSVVWDRSSAGYRLPTEAEWEYAARGGVGGAYAGGVKAEGVCAVANVLNPSAKQRFGFDHEAFGCEDGHAGAAPVGSFRANGYGLHDMTGNVWEWCWDWYGAYGGASADPTGAQSGRNRVVRGGSWFGDPRRARVARRDGGVPGFRVDYLGLRLVRTVF